MDSCLHTLTRRSEWDRIRSPGEDKIVPYSKLNEGDPNALNKLAVLKVNGGLGTSMGESPLEHPSNRALTFLQA